MLIINTGKITDIKVTHRKNVTAYCSAGYCERVL